MLKIESLLFWILIPLFRRNNRVSCECAGMLRYIDYNPSLSIRMSTPVISTHCLSFHLPLANGGSKKPFMEVNEVLEIEDDVKSRGCFGSSTGPKRALGVQCASHPYNSHCLQWGSRKVGHQFSHWLFLQLV